MIESKTLLFNQRVPFYNYLIGQNGPDEVLFPVFPVKSFKTPFFEFLNGPVTIEESVFIENLDEIESLIKEWESQRENECKTKDFKRKREILTIKSSDSGFNLLKNEEIPKKALKKPIISIE